MVKNYLKGSLFVCLLWMCFGIQEANAGQKGGCGMSSGGSCGKGEYIYQALTPDKQAKADAIIDDFAKKTQNLRENIIAKRLELQVLSQAKMIDRGAVQEVSKDLAKMHTELVEEYHKMYERFAKELGVRGQHMDDCSAMQKHRTQESGNHHMNGEGNNSQHHGKKKNGSSTASGKKK